MTQYDIIIEDPIDFLKLKPNAWCVHVSKGWDETKLVQMVKNATGRTNDAKSGSFGMRCTIRQGLLLSKCLGTSVPRQRVLFHGHRREALFVAVYR